MARRRTDLGYVADVGVSHGARCGKTAAQVHAELTAAGVRVSPRTVSRRMKEQRAPLAVPRASTLRAVAPSRPVASPAAPNVAPPQHDDLEAARAALADKVLGLEAVVHDWIECVLLEGAEAQDRAFVEAVERETARVELERASWPRCPACSQPVPPAAVKS